MKKQNKHWAVEFKTKSEDSCMWVNGAFSLTFKSKSSATKKYNEIVKQIVENGHGSWPGTKDTFSNKILAQNKYEKGDTFCRLKDTEFEIGMYVDKPYRLTVELCEYNYGIDYSF